MSFLGEITSLKELEHETTLMNQSTICRISDKLVVAAYQKTGNDGEIRAFEIASDGSLTAKTAVTFEATFFDVSQQTMVNLYDLSNTSYDASGMVAIAYKGSGNDEAGTGKIKTFRVTSAGAITAASTATFDSVTGRYDSISMCGIEADDGYQTVIAYSGVAADGFLISVAIDIDGGITVGNGTKKREFLTTDATRLCVTRIKAGFVGVLFNDVANTTSKISSFTVSGAGVIGATATGTLTHPGSAVFKNVDLITLDANTLALAYVANADDDGFIESISVSDDCATIARLDSLEFAADNTITYVSLVKIRYDAVALAYTDSAGDGFLKTFHINPKLGDPAHKVSNIKGKITAIGTVEHDTADGKLGRLALYKTDGYEARIVLNYQGTGSDGFIRTFEIEVIARPVARICFAAGTFVSTDQGEIQIQKLKPGIHTINNKKILHITKTFSDENYLVKIRHGAFSKNSPSKDLILTGNHLLKVGSLTYEPKNLIDGGKFKKLPYNNEPLYNILMENYSFINVQNVLAETLNPKNIWAKLSLLNVSSELKDNMILKYGKSIKNNNFTELKNVSGLVEKTDKKEKIIVKTAKQICNTQSLLILNNLDKK